MTGIPGTGKTSLIKALAHYTGRHIVNINLSHISTNGDLRKIFFNKMYQITGVNSHFMRLEFDQVIFVLEDVDAGAKKVVMDRSLLAAEEEAARAALSLMPKAEKPADQMAARLARSSGGSSSMAGVDQLNLSGLLNVLDGVVETPGRMVIMTSNHPEILDPALIRPGRIDKILELGYMDEPQDVVDMLEHYFPERPLTEDERARVAKCICEDEIQITPAQMEQLAMEVDSLPDFLERLFVYGKENEDDKDKQRQRIPSNFVIRAGKRAAADATGQTTVVSSTPTSATVATQSESADGDY